MKRTHYLKGDQIKLAESGNIAKVIHCYSNFYDWKCLHQMPYLKWTKSCIWIYETGGTDLQHNDGICNGSKTKQSVNMFAFLNKNVTQKKHVKLYIQYITNSKQFSYYLLNSHRFILVYSPTSLKFQLYNLKVHKHEIFLNFFLT